MWSSVAIVIVLVARAKFTNMHPHVAAPPQVSVLCVLNALAAAAEHTASLFGTRDLTQLVELCEEMTRSSVTNHAKLAFLQVVIMPLTVDSGMASRSRRL